MRKKTKETYDPYVMEKIQPAGGISFGNERYIIEGNGYEACVHIYGFPEEIDTNWLARITNIENSVVTVDIRTENIQEVKKNINKSMREQNNRYVATEDAMDKMDAEARYRELAELWKEVRDLNEVIKEIQIRIFMYAKTTDKLEELCANVITSLETIGYKAAIYLNEGETEIKSQYLPYEEQKKFLFMPYGQTLTSESLASGYPFHYAELKDPNGTLLGFTGCGGSVLLDLFHSDERRTYYTALVSGEMGKGKSTALKKIALGRAILNDYVRVFDITGEFRDLIHALGGLCIKMDGSQGMINPLQIFRFMDSESNDYLRQLAKISTFYHLFAPEADRYEINKFQEIVRETYIRFGIIPENREIEELDKITEYPVDKYPRMRDLLQTVEDNMQEISSFDVQTVGRKRLEDDLTLLNKIKIIVSNICMNYGKMFDGYTTFPNIDVEQIVGFDFSSIKGMDEKAYDAQVLNALTLSWDAGTANGQVMKKKYEDREIALEDVIHTLIVMDEATSYMNAKKMHFLESIIPMIRESRKFFVGFIFASQLISDYAPKNSTERGMEELSKLFDLTQYKFIFRQNENQTQYIEELFGSSVTSRELDAIPKLDRGETIMITESASNMRMRIYLTEEEEALFKGGV